MLRHRLTFGPILIALLIGLFWFDGWLDGLALSGVWSGIFAGREHLPSGMALFGVSLLILPVAAWELVRIFRANGVTASVWLTAAAAELGLILSFSIPHEMEAVRAVAIISTGLVGMFVVSLWYFSRGHNVDGVVAAAGGVMFAMIYLGFMFGFLLALRRWNSAWVILAILLITKSTDIGAYFTGRAIGKHKMIPWISPGKTWEGLVGGLVLAVIVASLLAMWGRSIGEMSPRPGLVQPFACSPLKAVFAGVIFGLAGQIGDLTASLLKRDAGLKDSSTLLPGFGGVLDVLDSPLLVAPVAYWLFSGAISAG